MEDSKSFIYRKGTYTKSKITLIEKKIVSREEQEHIISEKVSKDQMVAEFFNMFFINIVPNFKIPINYNYGTDFILTIDQIANVLNKFRNHPSNVMMKKKRKIDQYFSFVPVTFNDKFIKNK